MVKEKENTNYLTETKLEEKLKILFPSATILRQYLFEGHKFDYCIEISNQDLLSDTY